MVSPTAGVPTEAREVGSNLGRYVVLEEIGRGGMGRVLRAYDPKLQREVALKELRRVGLDDEGRARLVAEARAMAQLSHPNVVAVYDVEETDDVVLIMEFVAGQTPSTPTSPQHAATSPTSCWIEANPRRLANWPSKNGPAANARTSYPRSEPLPHSCWPVPFSINGRPFEPTIEDLRSTYVEVMTNEVVRLDISVLQPESRPGESTPASRSVRETWT